MYNEIFIIGRLKSMPDFNVIDNQVHDALIHVEVGKPYDEGMNEKKLELIPIVLWKGIADMINETCHVGSILSIKGRFLNCTNQVKVDGMHVGYIRCESVQILDNML